MHFSDFDILEVPLYSHIGKVNINFQRLSSSHIDDDKNSSTGCMTTSFVSANRYDHKASHKHRWHLIRSRRKFFERPRSHTDDL